MINHLIPIRTILLDHTALTDLTGQRIWAGESEPPESVKYRPDQGGAIAFMGTGGTGGYNGEIIRPRIQFKCYGGTKLEAGQVYQKLFDALHFPNYEIMDADLESGPIEINEPETDWPVVLSFWRIMIRNTEMV